jgi:hypothetical protein
MHLMGGSIGTSRTATAVADLDENCSTTYQFDVR